MHAPKPFFLNDLEKVIASNGVLCAEYTCTSKGTLKTFKTSIAFFAIGKSLSLPIIIATFFIITPTYKYFKKGHTYFVR
jgi:hypothetical protein